jgi:SAM-dependent methyltransferase
MASEILQSRMQIDWSLSELRKRRLSCATSPLQGFLQRLGFLRGIKIGDRVKGWDVLKTVRFIEDHVERNAPLLDIGAYASEILCILHRLGYTNLTGVDLNPNIGRMPHSDTIRYIKSDFMHTPFENDSFAAVTSISVIEHGFNAPSLFAEISRLLRPGGYFIASFDYWPEKIDTTGVKFFGMDWMIFSRQDIADFIKQAAGHGLVPVGELHFDAQEAPIEGGGKKYTFGWLALKKMV